MIAPDVPARNEQQTPDRSQQLVNSRCGFRLRPSFPQTDAMTRGGQKQPGNSGSPRCDQAAVESLLPDDPWFRASKQVVRRQTTCMQLFHC